MDLSFLLHTVSTQYEVQNICLGSVQFFWEQGLSSSGNRDYHAQNVESKTPICEFVVVVGPPIFPLDLLKEEYNRFAIPFI